EEEDKTDYTLTPDQNLTRLFEGSLQAEYISKTLDFLTKELVRLREERRISAMVKLAERTRRMRESEESGRRQAEIKRRKEEDEVFRQMMKVHQETVDSYLEDVIAGSVDETASVQARADVRKYADKINEIVDGIRHREEAGESDMTVADLVASFLIPEVERETLRNKIKHDQRKYLLAAHRTIYGELGTVERKPAPAPQRQQSGAEKRPTSVPAASSSSSTSEVAPPEDAEARRPVSEERESAGSGAEQ
ncbi:hypothetical protein BDK51DRAFT_33266, partial [Blyttiomyces helicus]